MTRYSQSGKVCDRCQMPGHEAKHHSMAVTDAVNRARQDEREKAASGKAKAKAGPKKSKDKPEKGRGKGDRNPAPAPEGKQTCKFGAKCQSLIQTGKCEKWYDKGEYAALRKTHQEFKAGTYTPPFDLAARKAQSAEKRGNWKGGKRSQQDELNGE